MKTRIWGVAVVVFLLGLASCASAPPLFRLGAGRLVNLEALPVTLSLDSGEVVWDGTAQAFFFQVGTNRIPLKLEWDKRYVEVTLAPKVTITVHPPVVIPSEDKNRLLISWSLGPEGRVGTGGLFGTYPMLDETQVDLYLKPLVGGGALEVTIAPFETRFKRILYPAGGTTPQTRVTNSEAIVVLHAADPVNLLVPPDLPHLRFLTVLSAQTDPSVAPKLYGPADSIGYLLVQSEAR